LLCLRRHGGKKATMTLGNRALRDFRYLSNLQAEVRKLDGGILPSSTLFVSCHSGRAFSDDCDSSLQLSQRYADEEGETSSKGTSSLPLRCFDPPAHCKNGAFSTPSQIGMCVTIRA